MENYNSVESRAKDSEKIGVAFTRKVNNSNLDVLDFKVVYILINLFRIKLL